MGFLINHSSSIGKRDWSTTDTTLNSITQHTCTDAANAVIEDLKARGFTPPIELPGRFPGRDKKPSNKAGSAWLYQNCAGGEWKDHSTGECGQVFVNSKPDTRMSSTSKYKPCAKESEQYRAIKAQKHRSASLEAKRTLDASTECPDDFPYLVRKGVTTGKNARFHNANIILPVQCVATGELLSLQSIDENGGKLFMAGGKTSGGATCCSETDLQHATQIMVCEGWVTGRSIFEHFPTSFVLAAFSAGNLLKVTTAAATRWPDKKLIIVGDDDRHTKGNPGATAAKKAALATGAALMLPDFPEDAPQHLSDFNDLCVWLAKGEVV